jgi:hypothetical protein
MLKQFEKLYYTPTISGLIENQQVQYSLARIHSHRHIARCLIYAEKYLQEFLPSKHQNYDVYFAISFHDIGRVMELEDHSSVGSIEIAIKSMTELKLSEDLINDTCRLIQNKDKSYRNDIYEMIVHDVDCLDIMRPSTGRGGIGGFDRSYLKLFRNFTGKQEAFISSAWKLISLTEDYSYENNNCLNLMINNIDSIWKNEFC